MTDEEKKKNIIIKSRQFPGNTSVTLALIEAWLQAEQGLRCLVCWECECVCNGGERRLTPVPEEES